jgi:ADP-ribose pyrophosphatase YjhB (NUDIX family)
MVYRLLLKIWRSLAMPDWLQWHLLALWTPKYRVAVAAILLNDKRQVLLCEHTYRHEYPWGLPGGSMKAREDPDCAIEREISEETGLSIRIDRPLMALATEDRPQISIIYLCTIQGGDFQPNAEVSRIQFFDFPDFPARLLPSERKIIERAFSMLD